MDVRIQPKFNLAESVRIRVQRSCQNPFYSIFREESTRQVNALTESRASSSDPNRNTAAPSTCMGSDLLYFPFRNTISVQRSRQDSLVVPDCVTLIGGTGFYGKFVATEYLQRGISVTLLVPDLEKSRQLFLPIADGSRERRRRESMGYVTTKAASSALPQLIAAEEGDHATGLSGRVLRYRFALNQSARENAHATSSPYEVTLEIVQGNAACKTDVAFASRHANIVYYLAPALSSESPWQRCCRFMRRADTSGQEAAEGSSKAFLNAFDACRRVDGHFVAMTPLWVHSSRLSPVYWYRRFMTHPWGYCRAVLQQEQGLLEKCGEPSPRCYFGSPEDDDEPRLWRYLWSILRSTELPEDSADVPRSAMRFSLFRLSDVVYPAFNQRLVAAKNNRVDDALHVTGISKGDLDASLLANVIAKTLGVCRSVIESRIDIAGRRKGGVDMKDSAAVFDFFERLRNE